MCCMVLGAHIKKNKTHNQLATSDCGWLTKLILVVHSEFLQMKLAQWH